MCDAPRQHAQMPYPMEVGHTIEGEEQNAHRVRNAARSKPQYAVPGNSLQQRTHGKDDQPAHSQINDGGGYFKSSDGEAFEDYTGDGERPYDGE